MTERKPQTGERLPAGMILLWELRRWGGRRSPGSPTAAWSRSRSCWRPSCRASTTRSSMSPCRTSRAACRLRSTRSPGRWSPISCAAPGSHRARQGSLAYLIRHALGQLEGRKAVEYDGNGGWRIASEANSW